MMADSPDYVERTQFGPHEIEKRITVRGCSRVQRRDGRVRPTLDTHSVSMPRPRSPGHSLNTIHISTAAPA